MRMLKGAILVLGGLFLTITLLSLLIPAKVRVSRGVVIAAPASKVFAQISNLRNWKHWQPVFKADTGAIHYSTGSTLAGSYCEWYSAGKKNSFRLTAADASSIRMVLSREGENDWQNMISVLPLSTPDSVQVEWQATTRLKWYPWEKFYGIFLEKVTGPGFEEALNNLKAYAEQSQ
ncbi:MAG: SRPBCC family protein [Ferruginibacter sp.]